MDYKVSSDEPFRKRLNRKSPADRASIYKCLKQLADNYRHPGLKTSKLGGTRDVFYARATRSNRVTFRWEDGGSSAEVKFNYTTNGAAMQLLQICEGLARQQELIELLQRRIKYDRLGVNDALLQFERDYSNGMLPEPQRALPLLEAIANDTKFVEIARQRARALAEKVRRPTGESSSTSAP